MNFHSAKYDILRNFSNNARELDALDNWLRVALNMDGAVIENLDFISYASPEGNFDYNKDLSNKRAKSLKDYTILHNPKLKNVKRIHSEGRGEDWKGLRKLLVEQDFDIPNAKKVVEIIDKYPTDVQRDKDIRALDNNVTYNLLLNRVYPKLRRSVFNAKYVVRSYTVEELPAVYAKKKILMSNYEFFQLAKFLEKKVKNPMEVYKDAYELFPNDESAIINYANAVIKYEKDGKKAIKLFDKVKDKEKIALQLAIAYHLTGDIKKADEILRKSAIKGNKKAIKVLQK